MTTHSDCHAAEESIAGLLNAGLVAGNRARLFSLLSNYSRSIVAQTRRAARPSIGDDRLERALNWLQRPVFVCGHHRSGTTLMQELLDGHPQLLVLPTEVGYFNSFARMASGHASEAAFDDFKAEWISRLIDPNGKRHFHLGRADSAHNPSLEFSSLLDAWHARLAMNDTLAAGLAPLLALAAAFHDVAMPSAVPLRWVEKTPLNERFFRRLAVLPNALFIQLVRDPAATLRSQLADLSSAGLQDIDPAEQAWRIARSFRHARRNVTAAPNRYLLIRYEDLTRDTAKVMTRVAEFVGIGPHDSLQCPTVLGHPVGSNSSFETSGAGEIRAAKQALSLTAAQTRIASAFASAPAREFGYEMSAQTSATVRWSHQLRLAPRIALRRVRRILRAG